MFDKKADIANPDIGQARTYMCLPRTAYLD